MNETRMLWALPPLLLGPLLKKLKPFYYLTISQLSNLLLLLKQTKSQFLTSWKPP